MVRHLVQAVVRHVGHLDPMPGGCLDVDVVVTDAVAGGWDQQLCALAPGEFKPRLIAPAEVTAYDAPDLRPRATPAEQDRLNTEPVVGAVTGLAVLTAGGREVGGDVILVQVSALNGPPRVDVTGLHGAALSDSVRTRYVSNGVIRPPVNCSTI